MTRINLVTLALLLSRGDAKLVDTEEVASKAHELNPGVFRWRTRPDQINLELVRVALSDAKKKRLGWVEGSGKTGWSLTSTGRRKAIELKRILTTLNPLASGQDSGGAGRGVDDSRRAVEAGRIQSTRAWEMWSQGDRNISTRDAAEVFRIDVYSTSRIRNMKINRLQSLFQDSDDMRRFLTDLSQILG